MVTNIQKRYLCLGIGYHGYQYTKKVSLSRYWLPWLPITASFTPEIGFHGHHHTKKASFTPDTSFPSTGIRFPRQIATLKANPFSKGTRTTTITPRHYLDFIHHFAKLYYEKRSELEDQQVHLNIGLAKIRETVEQVEDLQKSLAVKRAELERKNSEANSKLRQMMSNQQEAEKRKVESEETRETLNTLMSELAVKKSEVGLATLFSLDFLFEPTFFFVL